jgi:hypothetical protein
MLSQPRDIVQLVGLDKLKNKFNDFIGSLTRDLSDCSIAPQQTTLPRAHIIFDAVRNLDNVLPRCAILDYYSRQPIWMVVLRWREPVSGIIIVTWQGQGQGKIFQLLHIKSTPLWSSGQSSWLQIQRSRVQFLALPDFLTSSGSGTRSTRPCGYN